MFTQLQMQDKTAEFHKRDFTFHGFISNIAAIVRNPMFKHLWLKDLQMVGILKMIKSLISWYHKLS